MHALHRTQTRSAAVNVMDVMRPSEILGPPAPATDDPRRWLRVVWQVLLTLATAAAAAIRPGAASR